MANTYAKGDFEKIKEYMKNSFSFIMLLAFPLMFGIVSIVKDFVPLFYGPGYEEVIYLICIISPIIIAIGLSNVIGTQYLMPTKQQKKYTISVVSGAIVNLILNLILIKYWKSIGASIATVIAEFVVTGIQLYFVKNEVKIKEILKLSYKYCIAAFIMFICSLIVKNIFTSSILTICTQVVFSVIVYFSILLFMKDKFLINIINKKIRRK
jgi:O-antigen/teichoic acid export membrane protein